MSTGKIEVVCGSGLGKTALAFGKSLKALMKQKQVIVIQFLKGSQKQEDQEAIQCLEPDLKVFRFEKADCPFEQLSKEEKQEECINIRNGLNYAKKVLTTGECDLLVLDEVLELLCLRILEGQELEQILECRDEADVILTGEVLPDWLLEMADRIEQIDQVKVDNCSR